MKRPNEAMAATGVDRAPLLLGKVQLGSAHSDRRETLIEELFLRGVMVDPKEKIAVLKQSLLKDEREDGAIDPSEMKHFMAKLLIAVEWSKDCLQSSLEKIAEMRQTRNSR